MKIKIEITGKNQFQIREFYMWLRSNIKMNASTQGLNVKISRE